MITRHIKKWWALYLVIILSGYLIWSFNDNLKGHYKILNVYFTDSWECGKLGRISLVKFIRIKDSGSIWTIKSNGKVFDIDISKSDLIFDANDQCVNQLVSK